MGRHSNPASAVNVKGLVRKRDGHRCSECGLTNARHVELTGRALEVHRRVPGSLYTVAGCVTLCRWCHQDKPRRSRGQVDHAHPGKAALRADIVAKARIITLTFGGRPGDYLSGLIDTIRLDADHADALSRRRPPPQQPREG